MKVKEIILDVSELEAPSPLIEGAKAIKNLQDDEVLIFKHRMFPCKLQEYIDKFECKSEILRDEDNHFEIKIYK